MLTAHHLHKSYGIHTILKDVSFSINQGERVGLIGPNGSGKTTLLHILAGIDSPDQGQVTLTPGSLRVGFLAQGFEPPPDLLFGDLMRQSTGDLPALEQQLAGLADQLADEPDNKTVQDAYDRTLAQVIRAAEETPDQREAILASFGLDQIPDSHPVKHLSGGQKSRLALAKILLQNPDLLLLDEPTNHLDIGMLEWLEGWLQTFKGGVLIVSHDRTFLDRTVTRILDLDPGTQTLRAYTGNYSEYLEQYRAQVNHQWATYRDQEAEIRRMRQDIAQTKEQARGVEITTTSREPGVRRYAKKVAKKAQSRAKKLDRYLESDERVEKPKNNWQMKLDFGEPISPGKQILKFEQLSAGYTPDTPLITDLELAVRSGERIVLAGPNGCGKTTLLKTITGQIPPLAGRVSLGKSTRLGYMAQEQDLLDPELNALQTVQNAAAMNETEARSFLHFFLFSGDDPLRPTSQLSYGERARLLLAVLVIQGCSLLLLDEPINHLDIPSRERFEQALSHFNGTILAVVHDRYFIERFATRLWLVENGRIEPQVLVSEIDL
jgi:ATP-binding cassette, subfamily F, member 3